MAGLVALALGLVGCSSDDNPFEAAVERARAKAETVDPADEEPAEPLEVVWSSGTQVATRPRAVGGLVVVFVAESGELNLVGYDPATGTEVWRRDTTASNVTQGVVLTPAVDDTRVFHIAPGRGGSAAIEAVDGATGAVLWATEPADDGFGDTPDFCDESETTLCVSADGPDPDAGSLWAIDVETGAVTELGADTTGISGRGLGADLYDLYDSRDIARVVDGEIVWQRAPGELFGGVEVSPDYGWSWQEEGDLLVGWLGTPQDEWDADGPVEVPLVPQYVAGIDAATGETVWVSPGDLGCGYRLASLELEDDEPSWIRCQLTGSYTVQDFEVVAAAVEGTLEGFDPATGTTTWSVDIGSVSALFVEAQPLVRLGPSRFSVVRDDGTPFAVDLSNGEVIEVGPDDVGWCVATNYYDYIDSSYEEPIRPGEELTTPCDASGTPVPAPYRPDEQVGVVIGDMFVWMDEAGLHGARTGDPGG